MTEYEINYQFDADLFRVKKKDSSVLKSINIGDITLDFGSDHSVVGLEIMNASRNIIMEDKEKDPSDILKEVSSATIQERSTENSLQVILRLYKDKKRNLKSGLISQNCPTVKA